MQPRMPNPLHWMDMPHWVCERCGGIGDVRVVTKEAPDVVKLVPCPVEHAVMINNLFADPTKVISRPKIHNVIIGAENFTMEHPINCDLARCQVFARCREAWQERPADEGRYAIVDWDEDGKPVLDVAGPNTWYALEELGTA